ncbi:MAG: VTC domain-containing protein [Kofleriaceae bacterium]|nr:VTC domain-containing protein [Kofleriaceae bacterium]
MLTLSDTEKWRDQRERRFELSRPDAQQVLTVLGANIPVVTYKGGPATTLVVTIYFDTANGHYLKRAQRGDGSVIKVRAREYFSVSDDDQRKIIDRLSECYLEKKQRIGSIRNKERARISKAELGPIINHTVSLPENCEFLRDEIDEQDLQPALISMYERRVWGRGDLRVTLDERIRYYNPSDRVYGDTLAACSPDPCSPGLLGAPAALGPKRILEVKHSAQIATASWLTDLLSTLPEALGFSKFIDGMAALKQGNRTRSSLTRPVYSIPDY